MTFKQNIPVLAVLALAAGVVGAILFLAPSAQDRLRRAALQHAGTLGPVRDVRLFGTVADIYLADGKVVYADFAERDGQWVVSRDVTNEFEATIKAAEGDILRRLGQRVADRYQVEVKVKPGTRYEFVIQRVGQDLLGHVAVYFGYPKVGERQLRGRYDEIWKYAEGRWSHGGGGQLFDEGPGLRPRPRD